VDRRTFRSRLVGISGQVWISSVNLVSSGVGRSRTTLISEGALHNSEFEGRWPSPVVAQCAVR
jgi:hypothetical protein